MNQRFKDKLKAKTIRPLRKETGITLHDLGLDNNFLVMTPKSISNQNKVDFIKIKNFCTSKDTIPKNMKKTYRMGKSVCKSSKKGLNIQNTYIQKKFYNSTIRGHII